MIYFCGSFFGEQTTKKDYWTGAKLKLQVKLWTYDMDRAVAAIQKRFIPLANSVKDKYGNNKFTPDQFWNHRLDFVALGRSVSSQQPALLWIWWQE